MIFRLLFFALLSTAMGQSVVMTTMPSLGREVGLTEFEVALLMSGSALMNALGNTFWSRVGKRHGYRRVLITGLTGYTMGTIFFATVWFSGIQGWLVGSTLFLVLVISRSAQAVIMSATPPSVVGYAISISANNQRVQAISKVSSAYNLGQILGPTIAGLLVGIHLIAPLYAISLMTCTAMLLVWLYLPNNPNHQQTDERKVSSTSVNNAKRPSVAIIITANALVFLAIAMMQQSLGFFMIDQHGVSTIEAAQRVGLAMMVSAVCALTVQFTVVQGTSMLPSTLIKLALTLLFLGFLSLYLHKEQGQLYFAMVLIGCGTGISYPSIAAFASSTCRPENQAKVTGYITASPAVGYIVGPPIAASLYQFSHRGPFLVACLLLGIMTLFAIVRFGSSVARKAI